MRKIVFIAGCWRSGSTLLGDVLGGLEGFVHVGELHHVWSRGLMSNWLCGCGEPFRECRFWSRVMEPWMADSSIGVDGTRAAELERIRRAMLREMTCVDEGPAVCGRYPGYLRESGELIGRVFEASGAEVIVDSSKSFRQALILLAGGGVELYVVHLVRDPRAVVHSLVNRPKRRLDDPGGSAMLGLDPDRAVGLWLQSNRQAAGLAQAPGCRYLLVRYEDFVESPRDVVGRIVGVAGESGVEIGDVGAVEIPASHTISGNPDRLRGGARIRAGTGLEGIDSGLCELVEGLAGEELEGYGYAANSLG